MLIVFVQAAKAPTTDLSLVRSRYGLPDSQATLSLAEFREQALAGAVNADAVLLADPEHGQAAIETCRDLQGSGLAGQTPLIVIGPDCSELAALAVDAGAWDYFPHGCEPALVQARLRSLVRRSETIRQLFREAAREANQSRRLGQLLESKGRLLAADLQPAELMRRVAEEAASLTKADGVVVELRDGECMVYSQATGAFAPFVGLHLKISDTLSGLCVSTGEVLRCDDSETDHRARNDAPFRISLRSMVCTPLYHQEGVVGVLKIAAARPYAFDELDMKILAQIGQVVATALRRQAQAEDHRELLASRTAALEESRRATGHFQALLHAAPVAICVRDSQRRITDWNPAAEVMFGWSSTEVLGRNDNFLIPEDLRIATEQAMTTLLSGIEFPSQRSRRRTSAGNEIHVRVSAAPLIDSLGKPAGLISIMEDVSAQVSIERKERQLQAELEQRVAERTLALRELNGSLRREVDERSRAELLARKQNSMLAAHTNNTPLLLVELDGNGFITLWSARAEEVLGWAPEDVLHRQVRDIGIVHPDDLAVIEELIAALIQGVRNSGSVTLRADTRAGARVICDWYVSAVRVDGRLESILGFGLDVTARRVAEQSLASTSRRLNAIFEQAAVGLALVGTDGRWLEFNERLCTLLGYTSEELLELTFQDITHPDDLDADLAESGKLFAGLIPTYTMDKRYIRKDGTPVWVNLTASVNRDPDGNITEAIIAVKDISARIEAQDRLRLFQRALMSTLNGVIISDACTPDQPVIFANPAAERLTGYSAAELHGQNCRILQAGDEDQPELKAIRRALRHGGEAKAKLRNYRKDGSLFINELSIAPVHDGGGKLTHFVGIQNDVTARERMLEELQESRAELEHRVEERTEQLAAALKTIRESEKQLRDIAETAPGVVYQWYVRLSGETGFYYMSPRSIDIFGVPPEALMNLGWDHLIHPDDLIRMEASIKGAETVPANWTIEVRVRDGEGWRWTRMQSHPVKVTRSEAVFTGIVTDITEEHRVKTLIAENERRFRALAEGSIQGIVVESIQNDFKPLFVNEAAARMFGFESPEEILALSSVKSLMPDATAEKGKSVWPKLARGEIRQITDRVEVNRKCGTPMWVDLMGSVVSWDGEPAFQMTLIDVTKRREMENELRRLASVDSLTGLLNRRQFQMLADQEFRRARRYLENLVVLCLDIDFFKKINDLYGHGGGDAALQHFAEILRRELRESDISGRVGGEEFAVVLPNTTSGAAADAAERIRLACANAVVSFSEHTVRLTTSIGIATCHPGDDTIERALRRADLALYAAKSAGRNQVKIYEGLAPDA